MLQREREERDTSSCTLSRDFERLVLGDSDARLLSRMVYII